MLFASAAFTGTGFDSMRLASGALGATGFGSLIHASATFALAGFDSTRFASASLGAAGFGSTRFASLILAGTGLGSTCLGTTGFSSTSVGAARLGSTGFGSVIFVSTLASSRGFTCGGVAAAHFFAPRTFNSATEISVRFEPGDLVSAGFVSTGGGAALFGSVFSTDLIGAGWTTCVSTNLGSMGPASAGRFHSTGFGRTTTDSPLASGSGTAG